MTRPPSSLWTAFEDGCQFETEHGPIEMQCRDVGSLVLPTGRIVACDPLFDLAQKPFSTRVAPYEYPVFLALTDLSEVALSMIQFAEGEPIRWVRANPTYFSVDSGTACIMDVKLARTLVRAAENGRFDRYWKRVEDEMAEIDGLWGNVRLHAESGTNMIALRPRGGDGSFCSYWGFSEERNLLCLVTDFFLEDIVPGDDGEEMRQS